ncbi:hypothetical protein FACS1894120_1850 [Clostridia bacterium]|nr:hypothetical protein FACS1894120_1850 [Clostridia bacterium]
MSNISQVEKERCEKVGEYILETKCTVRTAAGKFGVSKSTVHMDITKRLPMVNAKLYGEVEKIVQLNKAQRHFRGGESTRQKYLKLKQTAR